MPGAVTPKRPITDLQALGQWLIQIPDVTLADNPMDEGTLEGSRVDTCGDNDISYLVPAGVVPTEIGDSVLGDLECTAG
jgi:hypothetical protein